MNICCIDGGSEPSAGPDKDDFVNRIAMAQYVAEIGEDTCADTSTAKQRLFCSSPHEEAVLQRRKGEPALADLRLKVFEEFLDSGATDCDARRH
jgi:hypothetical protein